MALKEKIPCPRCDAKGILPRYYYNKKGICFLCWGEKYIYVKIPKGQDKDDFVAKMKKDEADHLDNHPPKVAMPDKMRNKAFEDEKERKAFGGGDTKDPDPEPEKKPDPEPEKKDPRDLPLPDELKDQITEQLLGYTKPKLEKLIKQVDMILERQGDKISVRDRSHYEHTRKSAIAILADRASKRGGKAKPKPKPEPAKKPEPETGAPSLKDEIAKKFPLDQALARAGISETDPEKAYLEAIAKSGMDVDSRAMNRIQTRADRTARKQGGSPTLWAARIMMQTKEAKPLSKAGKKHFDALSKLTKDEVQERGKVLEKDLKKADTALAKLTKKKEPDTTDVKMATQDRDALRVELTEVQNILGRRDQEDLEYNKVAGSTGPDDFTLRQEVVAEYTGPDGTKRLLAEFRSKAENYQDYKSFKKAEIKTKSDEMKQSILMDRLLKAKRIQNFGDVDKFFREIGGNVADESSKDVGLDPKITQRIKQGVSNEVEARELGKLFMNHLAKSKSDAQVTLENEMSTLIANRDRYKEEYMDMSAQVNRERDTMDAREYFDARNEKVLPLQKKYTEAVQEVRRKTTELASLAGTHRMEELAKYREFGDVDLKWKGSPNKRVAQLAQDSTKFVPKTWLENAVGKQPLASSKSRKQRAFFLHAGSPDAPPSQVRSEIHLPSGTDESVASHELLHYIEFTNPEVRELERQFYDRRTEGKRAVARDGGIFKDGGFPLDYIGKSYTGGSFELLTVGIQIVQGDPRYAELFDKDEEYTQFVLGTLLGGAV